MYVSRARCVCDCEALIMSTLILWSTGENRNGLPPFCNDVMVIIRKC